VRGVPVVAAARQHDHVQSAHPPIMTATLTA
jgi:hypothetical protein